VAIDVDATFGLLAAELAARRAELVADYTSRLREELPEWSVERPELADTIRVGAGEAIGGELRALAEGTLPETCPEFDAEGARQCARLGVPLDAVVLQYRLGHAVQWDAWFEIVEGHALSAAHRRELLERGSRFFFAYANRLTRFVVAEYESEHEKLLRQSEQRRAFLVRELLAGRDIDAAPLGYDLELHHLGVIAWGDAPDAAIGALARTLDRTALVVSADRSASWGWLGGVRPLAARRLSRLNQVQLPEETRLALGDEEQGPEGFRRTHRQAAMARRIGERRPGRLIAYGDVALEALASADRRAAAEFVARELRALDGSDRRSERLRETLAQYFRCGQNAAAAAAALGVHQQTVGQRLRTVEERIGGPVNARRAELEVALRLRDCLDRPHAAP
jgi:DNA-binding PucR family transcriptional regulator